MSKKKVNPRRRPVTQADVNRAKAKSSETAMARILYLVLYVFLDKHDATPEELQQLADEINYQADSINRGYISWNDIIRAVKDDYGVCIPWNG